MRTSGTIKLYVPFYQFYTPYDILTKAEFTNIYSSHTPTEILYTAEGDTRYERLFKLHLLPGGVLSHSADVVVVITMGLDSEGRSGDSDPKFFLSNGLQGIGFELRDNPYCRGIQATMGNVFDSRTQFSSNRPESDIHPEEIIMTFKPSQHWGSCNIAIDGGVISPVNYTQSIYPDQGLWLEVYREDTDEEYAFNYIKVEIHENY